MKRALFIVDLQFDFCPGGALGVKDGDTIVPIINGLMSKFDHVFASKDWHPAKTPHFDVWPPHCIRATPGAEFHRDLNISPLEYVFLKGTGASDDGYSAFEATNADLATYLRKMNIGELFFVGLTTDYCVKSTALDARKFDFNTYVIIDAIKAVNLKDGDGKAALREMETAGVKLINSSTLRDS